MGKSLTSQPVEGLPRLRMGFNAIWTYGQSNAEGSHATPQVSRPVQDAVMLGDSPRAQAPEAYAALNGPNLRPLQGGPYGATTCETPDVAAAAMLRRAMARFGHGTDRRLICGNGAAGGASIRRLIQGHTHGRIEFYSRYTDWLDSLSTTLDDTPWHVVAAILMQGESNFTTPRRVYLLNLRALYTSLCADAGQSIALFCGAPGGKLVKDADFRGQMDLPVHMAMQDFAADTPGVFLVGPYASYGLRRDRIHLTPQGVAAFGRKIGQAMACVLVERRRWEPCRVIDATSSGRRVWINCLVPHPPILAAEGIANWSITLKDSQGALTLVDKSITDETTILTQWDRRPGRDALLYVGGEHPDDPLLSGLTVFHDSDPHPAGVNWLVPWCGSPVPA